MMREIAQNGQLRAIAMALAGAIVAAVATMFVPTAVLETMTGSTGLSELIPATAAPLGDTARALIAFGTGILTFALLAVFLTRGERVIPRTQRGPAAVPADNRAAPSLRDRLQAIKLPKIALPKMPWVKGDDDITELSDLPKLRGGDIHPDAPPRRPLVATQDLPELDLASAGTQLPEWTPAETHAVIAPVAFGQDVTDPVEAEPVEAEPAEAGVFEVPAIETLAFETGTANPSTVEPAAADTAPSQDVPVSAEPEPAPPAPTAEDHQPTLADMVAKLEAAVAQRQEQLRALEMAAVRLTQPETSPEEAEITPEVDEGAIADILPPQPERARPPLEAVASTAVKPHDMDAALTAALETLQRMNAVNR